MPLYEYRCTSCGHQQEFLQKLSDAPMSVCTACGKETFSKLLSAAGFQLKGSGWYATDFKNSGAKAASAPAKADASKEAKADGGASKTESKGESKSESKGESKAESKGESKAESKKDASPPASGSGAAC